MGQDRLINDLRKRSRHFETELTKVKADLVEANRKVEAAKLTIAEMEKTGGLVLAERDEAVVLLEALSETRTWKQVPVYGTIPALREEARELLERIKGGASDEKDHA